MIFNFFNKNEKDYFLGILLKEHQGSILLMKKYRKEIYIEERSDFEYTNGWENLTEDIDERIYQLEEKNKITISKTIFFIYSHLIDEKTNNIKFPYLKKIKDLVKDLNLTALGYIECRDAVFSYIEEKKGNFFSGAVIELDDNIFSFFLFEKGTVIFKKTIARTDNISDDFDILISELKNKNLIISGKIFIYRSKLKNKDQLLSFDWKNYFSNNLDIEFLNEEIFYSSLAKIFSKQIFDDIENKPDVSEEKFGFFVANDNENFSDNSLYKKENKKFINFLNIFLNFSGIFKNFFSKKNFSFILNSKLILIFGLLLILLGLFVNEYFFHRATINIYLPSKKIEKEINLEIDYKISTLTANFSERIITTGRKEIGEKAKGKIIIHNFDDKESVFKKGTIIESSGLKFLLNEDVKVASSSITVDGSAKLPGKKEAEVVAFDIGDNYNLKKGSRFKIENFSENLYFGINQDSFSGGSKKTLKTVSSSDFLTLENKIIEKAKDRKYDFKIDKNYEIIEDLTDYKITKKKFSKEIGEESEFLEIDAEVSVNYFSFNKNNLINYLINELKENMDKNFYISKENIKYKIKEIQKKKDKIYLSLMVSSKAVIDFDKEKALRLISGKNKNRLDEILMSNFNVKGYDLSIDKFFPILNNYMPFFKKNIFLNISYL